MPDWPVCETTDLLGLFLGFSENGPKKRQYPVRGNSLGENVSKTDWLSNPVQANYTYSGQWVYIYSRLTNQPGPAPHLIQ